MSDPPATKGTTAGIRRPKNQERVLHLRMRSKPGTNVALIDRNFKVEWASDSLERLFPGTSGHVCYRVVKRRGTPCPECPVTKTFEDGLVHVGMVSAPSVGPARTTRYSEIIAVPYRHDRKGNIETVLHILVDRTAERELFLEGEAKKYDFRQMVTRAVLSAPRKSLLFLLLLAGVAREGLDFDQAQILLGRRGSTSFTQHRAMRSTRTQSLCEEFLAATQRRQILNLLERLEHEFDTPEGKVLLGDSDQAAMRLRENLAVVPLGPQRVAVRLEAFVEGMHGFFILSQSEDNVPAFEGHLLGLKVFLADIAQTFVQRDKLDRMGVVRKRAEKLLTECREDKGTLIYAVPLAIGKIHALDRIHARLDEAVGLLRDVGGHSRMAASVRRQMLDSLDAAVEELGNVMDSMTSLARMSKPNLRKTNLRNLVDEVEPMLHVALFRQGVTLDKSKVRAIELKCDSSLIIQVFYNLIDNSLKAFSDTKAKRGWIRLRTIDLIEEIQIEFEDNASGIAPHYIDEIWKELFSTRGSTGLGLFFVKHIVEAVHGGRIGVKSRWGEGTTFTIVIPKRI